MKTRMIRAALLGLACMTMFIPLSFAVIHQPARIGGILTANGVQITQETDEGYVVVVTDATGTPFQDFKGTLSRDADGLNTFNYYIIDIPIFDATDQPLGAKPGSAAVIHIYRNSQELAVTSPVSGSFIIPDMGTATTINLDANDLTVPGAPTGATATPGDAQATVSFTPPSSDGGSPIISYTVTSSPGGKTATGPASPLTVTGLTNATSYTFTVTATNAVGTGPASTPSNSVTPTAPATVPKAPTGATATPGDAQATVSFTPPSSDGGSPITGYEAISSPDGMIGKGTTSPITVSGLTNGTAYTFKVRAMNAVGTGPASAPSNSVTPVGKATVPGAPTIGKATAGDAQATVSFTPPSSDGGSPITGYKAISSPGGMIGKGTASPITVKGLTNGRAYTFKVRAMNAVGTGPASAPSNKVTPTGNYNWHTEASMPSGADWAGSAVAAGKLYVIGGGAAANWNKMRIYNPATAAWTQKAVGEMGYLLRAATISNKIFIFDTSDPGNPGWIYNLKTKTLSPLGVTPPDLEWTSEPAVCNGKIYFFGGNGPKKTTWQFNPATLQFTKRASMPTAGYGSSTAILSGKIYVIGGNYRYNKIEIYDPETNTWAPSLSFSALGLWGWDTVAPVGDKIGIVETGGKTFLFNPATKKLAAQASMPRDHGDYPIGEGLGGRLYVAGGESGPKLLDSFGPEAAGGTITSWSPEFDADEFEILEADCRAVETLHRRRMERMQRTDP